MCLSPPPSVIPISGGPQPEAVLWAVVQPREWGTQCRTGLFKTGKLFNFMRSNIVPDMVSFAKSFGGGKSSIAGYIIYKKIFKGAYGESKYATLHSTTYSGLGEEAATAIKSIEIALRDVS